MFEILLIFPTVTLMSRFAFSAAPVGTFGSYGANAARLWCVLLAFLAKQRFSL